MAATSTSASLNSPPTTTGATAIAQNETPPRRRPRVLLGITGSVAAVKGPEIAIRLRQESNVDVQVLLTQGGHNFWTKAKEYNSHYWEELETCSLPGSSMTTTTTTTTTSANGKQEEASNGDKKDMIHVHYAEDEWKGWNRLGDPVLHIDLRDWADVLLIAPLSAHTLAKIANGLCDDTLSCVVRAWDLGHGVRPGKPIILAPAMNTAMFDHPLTRQQLSTVQGFWNTNGISNSNEQNGIQIVAPQVKTLACGEVGNGALAPVEDILSAVAKCCAERKP